MLPPPLPLHIGQRLRPQIVDMHADHVYRVWNVFLYAPNGKKDGVQLTFGEAVVAFDEYAIPPTPAA
ncbi:hypothetical protein L2Y90_26675 [Burkholderia pyrrocinia]|uniref:hypothetical protein n=1 Tax=Burkholderia pyrrocinia TaxID=60550 RepID=UPI00215B552F|nr:hypothetical protein [Burkholderia pyrrocinia]UVE67709.1 hypothetical protein L2Y90_26675 [Burkholderia pyrrocinia]